MNAPPLSVIDLFSGCGGTSAGLRDLGMRILCGVDLDPSALKTFRRNIEGATTIETDVRELTVEELRELVDIPETGILLSACAPCQPFSRQNGNIYSDAEDQRFHLIDELDRYVLGLEPDYIILENVPGLQRHPRSPYVRFKQFLEEQGYHCADAVLNAADYGVAQFRHRLVLIASRHGPIELPVPTHGTDRLPYVSVGDAIGRFPEISAGKTCSSTPNHQSARLSPKNLERIRMTPEGGDWRDWPKELRLTCHADVGGYTDTYGRMKRDEPARTLTTRCNSYSNGRFGHPTQDRAISAREAAAIQSFEDDFVFEGTLKETTRQVGNAVPVRFAAAVGGAVDLHWKELHCG